MLFSRGVCASKKHEYTCIYLDVFLVKMAVAHVVFIDDIAIFYVLCMICAC